MSLMNSFQFALEDEHSEFVVLRLMLTGCCYHSIFINGKSEWWKLVVNKCLINQSPCSNSCYNYLKGEGFGEGFKVSPYAADHNLPPHLQNIIRDETPGFRVPCTEENTSQTSAQRDNYNIK